MNLHHLEKKQIAGKGECLVLYKAQSLAHRIKSEIIADSISYFAEKTAAENYCQKLSLSKGYGAVVEELSFATEYLEDTHWLWNVEFKTIVDLIISLIKIKPFEKEQTFLVK